MSDHAQQAADESSRQEPANHQNHSQQPCYHCGGTGHTNYPPPPNPYYPYPIPPMPQGYQPYMPPPPQWQGEMQQGMYQGPGSYQHQAPQQPPVNNPLVDQAQAMVEETLGVERGVVSQLLNSLGVDDREFWKGAMIGAAASLLLSNEDIRNKLSGLLSEAKGLMASNPRSEDSNSEEPVKSEQQQD